LSAAAERVDTKWYQGEMLHPWAMIIVDGRVGNYRHPVVSRSSSEFKVAMSPAEKFSDRLLDHPPHLLTEHHCFLRKSAVLEFRNSWVHRLKKEDFLAITAENARIKNKSQVNCFNEPAREFKRIATFSKRFTPNPIG
jgi:hypothetical protein